MEDLAPRSRGLVRLDQERIARVTSLLRCPLLLVWTAFAASTFLRSPPGYNMWLDAFLYNASFLIAAAICLGRGTGVGGAPWLVIGGGIGVFGAASFYSTVWLGQGDVPVPSLADWLWLAFYPAAYVALALLIRNMVERVHASMLLDGAVAGLGAGALVVAFLLGPVLGETHGPLREIATNLAYPTGDVLLLIMTVGAMALLGWRFSRLWAFLALGFVAFAVADTIFLFEDAKGTYSEGGPLDVGWPLAAVLIGFAAVSPRDRRRVARLEGASVYAVPAVFSLAAVVLLAYDQLAPLPTTAVALALGTIVASLARFGLTLRELQSLSDSRRQARTDELTGLANRRLFFERIAAGLLERRRDWPLSVLLVDLDRFKEVNDSLGHNVGDQLLEAVGSRIAETIRPQDLVARLGGDEFAVVVDGDADSALRVASRLGTLLAAPFEFAGIPLHVGASIGISCWPADGESAHDLLAHADIAMYRAKDLGTCVEFYVPGSDRAVHERLQLLEALRAGLKREEIVVHFQPKLDLRTGRYTSVEALARWEHPTRGLLHPVEFLAAAEQSGLLRQLTTAVARQAAAEGQRLWSAGFDVDLAINLSSSNLVEPDFSDELISVFTAAGIGAERLILEVTEHRATQSWAQCAHVLHRFKTLGAQVSVDDYGAGQSSLAYLRELPLDELKIDASFISALPTGDSRVVAIVRSTVTLARELGIRVVAEGVASADIMRAAVELDCDEAQGVFVCPPLPAEALERWFEEHRDAGGRPSRVRVATSG